MCHTRFCTKFTQSDTRSCMPLAVRSPMPAPQAKTLLYQCDEYVVYRARCSYSGAVVMLKGYLPDVLDAQMKKRVCNEVNFLQVWRVWRCGGRITRCGGRITRCGGRITRCWPCTHGV
eukprot:363208-Chlamydomonas_euryale.AAC.10